MKSEDFWRKLISKMIERMEHDKLLYGDSYTEIVYDKNGLLKSITFSDKMENKVVVNG